jgi:hypothetical protein
MMVITGINITWELMNATGDTNATARADSSSYFYCRAVVTLRTRAGARVAKARVSGVWSDTGVARLNPTAATSAASSQTRTNGQAVFRSRSFRAAQQPQQQPAYVGSAAACMFTVSNVEFPGKILDWQQSVTTQTLKWNGK